MDKLIFILIPIGLLILLVLITLFIANRYYKKRMKPNSSSKNVPDYTSADIGGGII